MAVAVVQELHIETLLRLPHPQAAGEIPVVAPEPAAVAADGGALGIVGFSIFPHLDHEHVPPT
jgi:hypothetical protein